MGHYTEFIPKDLALKLQDAGMPIEWEDNSPDEHTNTDVKCLTTYAEVMDWFMEKEIDITIAHVRHFCGGRVEDYKLFVNGEVYGYRTSWHSAANTAIKRAIRLLEEG